MTTGEVWVYIQRQGQDIAEASREILGKGIALARQLKVPTAGLILGEKAAQLADTIRFFPVALTGCTLCKHPT
jgi:hypothetical protein